MTIAKEARAPGNTLMAGVKGDTVGLWLLSEEGEELREWIPPYDVVFADTGHIEGEAVPVNAFFTSIHGAAFDVSRGKWPAGATPGPP